MQSAVNHLVVSGLNYHCSPIAIRERFTIPESCLGHALIALAKMPHIKEAVLLSTCNRIEVYAAVTDVPAGLHEIETFFVATQTISDHEALRPNFKLLREDAALHLFRVASGLDSMILGEGQIMSQVKRAHQSAIESNVVGSLLDQVFKLALKCGKRVRTETSLARKAVSLSSAGIELAKRQLGSLRDKTVLVIGAGKMAQICVKHLLSESGSGPILLVNRSQERINSFLQNNLSNRERLKVGFGFEDRYQLAAAADLVIVSTEAGEYLLKAEEFTKLKREREQLIIDLSVPRNVDPEIANLTGVKLFNTDELSEVVAENKAERAALIGEAEQIIFETLDEFHGWQRSLLVVPTIADLRKRIESIRVEQMQKTERFDLSAQSSESQKRIEEISRAIVNQILHHPMVQLKATRDKETLRQQAQSLRKLFNLDALSKDTQQLIAEFIIRTAEEDEPLSSDETMNAVDFEGATY